MSRSVFKKQKQDLLGEAILLEEDLLWDKDIQELRLEQLNARIVKQERRRAEEAARRYRRFFFQDGSCRAHDRDGCRECSQYANGRCPSYLEERS